MPVSPPFEPVAAVFDLDGLLVDSEDAWGVAERRVVEGLGHEWDETIRTLLLGRGPRDAAATLAAFLGESDVDRLERLVQDAAMEELRTGVVARPGAVALVEGACVPLAIATNSSRRLAEVALASVGLTAAFTVMVCVDDVAEPKPAPDPYRLACELLAVPPRRTVGLEDSPVGVASAKAAGLWVIGCPSFAGSDLSHADAVVDSLSDVAL